jgi:hypothetical protein
MQLANVNSTARYGGYLSVVLPEDHWAHRPDGEGGLADLRIVTTHPVMRDRFASMADAVAAARRVSAGARDAVAVVRDPGAGDDGPWSVEQLLVVPAMGAYDGYQGIDLEGLPKVRRDLSSVWQPLQSQRQVIIGAIVDGPLLIDDVTRYSSTRPDLPGRDPDHG